MFTMSDFQSVWREFEHNEITHSAAHYLLGVAALSRQGDAPRAADLARRLGVSRAAVSLQLRTLRDHGWLTVDDGHLLHLSPEGADMVSRIAGKRAVVKSLLQDILGVSEETAETDACKVEHLLSEESASALLRLLRVLRTESEIEAKLDAIGPAEAAEDLKRICDLYFESLPED